LMTTTNSSLEVNPKEALPPGSPVDRVVLRYSKPSHRAFISSVMQRLQQPEVSPRQLLAALTDAVDEMEAEEARKEEEERKKAEEEARRAEEEKRRIEEYERKRAEEEEARRVAEEKKKAEEEAKRVAEEMWRAELEKRRAEEEEWKRAQEEAHKEEEERRKKAEEEAAKEEARKAAEMTARACGVCKASNPSARAVFATCGHVACLGCAEGAAARGSRLECPFCAAPTTYMRLFERELLVAGTGNRGPDFIQNNTVALQEVKEFDKDEDEPGSEVAADPATVRAV
ncbi:hypothetical protein PMAYCL1PPCAC_21120, partial [Pristionchus mayeri]